MALPMKQLLFSARCYAGLFDYVLLTPTPRRPHAPAGLFLVQRYFCTFVVTIFFKSHFRRDKTLHFYVVAKRVILRFPGDSYPKLSGIFRQLCN